MATATLVPLEEYLHTSYQPDRDWVDGELKERNMGEGPHSNIQNLLSFFFNLRAKALNIRVNPEHRVQVSSSHYRVPDLLLVDNNSLFERILRTPPLLCIEILSPDDRMMDMEEKISDYLRMGVPTVWVINPRGRSALIIDGQGQRAATVLTASGLDFSLPLGEVFAELDELEARSLGDA